MALRLLAALIWRTRRHDFHLFRVEHPPVPGDFIETQRIPLGMRATA
ncbi:MAG: hypothetical protein KF773_02345 [Deltaproteobacteria bacterium]|nr:hypothetical protein [Deltaproteobacteria bacterium]MCW5801185.1 hypothetical protein [Deltaproteobacteria bacterium]